MAARDLSHRFQSLFKNPKARKSKEKDSEANDVPAASLIQTDEFSPSFNIGPITASGHASVNTFGVVNAQNFIQNFPAPSQPEKQIDTNKEPGSTVSFPRDPQFVHRKGIFEELDVLLANDRPYRWAALYGLGGIGKSQIAIEYSYRIRSKSPDTWVFWVSAISPDSFKQSFRTVAEALALPGYKEIDADIFAIVERWLNTESNGSWFIILDNLDDISVISETPEESTEGRKPADRRPLISYIPLKNHGGVLVTSRFEEAASFAVPEHLSRIKVESMDVNESIALLRCRCSVESTDLEHAKRLVEALEYIPLAISQAGSYIRQQRSQMTIREYLTAFEESQSNQMSLLNQERRELRRDFQVPNSIILTWEISFRQIERTNKTAAKLLCLLAMFHRMNIPLTLLDTEDPINDRDALYVLEAFSFITILRSPGADIHLAKSERKVTFHRLVQLAIKRWLGLHDKLEKWERRAVRRISRRFPDGSQHENWGTCEELSPHAEAVLFYASTNERKTEMRRAILLYNLTQYHLAMFQSNLAISRASECHRILEQYLEHDEERRLQAKNLLAEAYRMGDQASKAKPLQEQVLAMYKEKFGPDHVETIRSMTNLARSFIFLNELEEAEALQVQIRDKVTEVFGPAHLQTLASMHILACIYYSQERWVEATSLFEKVIPALAAEVGGSHPYTLISMHMLTEVYSYQERWEDAEKLGVKVWELSKETFGADHLRVTVIMAILAQIWMRTSSYDKAISLQADLIQRLMHLHGPEDSRTVEAQERLDLWKQLLQRYLGLCYP